MSAGTVYLLHFDRPYHHAAHYIGWTEGLERRIQQHQCGDGARLITVVVNAGITFVLARTWAGDRTLKRRIKTLGSARRVCPICSPRRRWAEFRRRASA